jgi:hypothetical protein
MIGAHKKLKKWLRPLFRPKTNHTCPQKPNPSRETVPLNIACCALAKKIMFTSKLLYVAGAMLFRCKNKSDLTQPSVLISPAASVHGSR